LVRREKKIETMKRKKERI